MKKALFKLLLATGLILCAGSAFAHVGGEPWTQVGLSGIGLGALAGLYCGYKGFSHGVGMGGALLLLYVELVAVAGFQGELLSGAFLLIYIIPLVGLVPLTMFYFITHALVAGLKRQFAPADTSYTPTTTDEH